MKDADKETLQSYKYHGLYVFSRSKSEADHSSHKKKNDVVTHTILPKFEINGSIKILNEKAVSDHDDES